MPSICAICKINANDWIYICSNHKGKINKFDDILSEIEKLKKQLQDKIDEINKLNNKINELNNKINELNKKVKEYDELKIDFDKFKENFEGNKKSNEFYDAILNINSILELNKGWEIKFNSEQAKEKYDKMKEEEILKVGVIGNGNKGKSFFLSKISDYELPTGTSIRTEGLSLKYPDNSNKKIILMDSAGFETPLLDNNNIRSLEKENYLKELENTARDKLITEKFLQNFIVRESDILICVIGILTYNEQKLINRIKNNI